MNNTSDVNKARSIILLKDLKAGAWHYIGRSTNVADTMQDLKDNPMNLQNNFTFHGVYESYLQTLSVAKKLHDEEVLSKVQVIDPKARLNPYHEDMYD